MAKIRFTATLTAIGTQTILRLPPAASRKLPSRGMCMVEGTFDGHAFQAPLEPDGRGSHWFNVSNTLFKAAGAKAGDSVSVALEPMAVWPEPKVPVDLAEALASDQQVRKVWLDITPLARWDWIRWIGATRNLTRAPFGSRRRSRNSGQESARLAASTAVNARTLQSRATACCSNQRPPQEGPTAGKPNRKGPDASIQRSISSALVRAASPCERRGHQGLSCRSHRPRSNDAGQKSQNAGKIHGPHQTKRRADDAGE